MKKAVVDMVDGSGAKQKMIRIPKFNLEDVDPALGSGPHPAFITKNGVRDAIYLGAHQAAVVNGKVRVISQVKNTQNVTFDEARALCSAMGPGWHLTNAWEWSAMVMWILMQGKNPFSIAWWEWTDGLKIVDGKLFFPESNTLVAEADWPEHGVFFDVDNEEQPLLATEVKKYQGPLGSNDYMDYAYQRLWASLGTTEGYDNLPEATKKLMMQLLIAPVEGYAKKIDAPIWVRNYGERFPLRGGRWTYGASAGLAYLILDLRRAHSNYYIGFRPAFVNDHVEISSVG